MKMIRVIVAGLGVAAVSAAPAVTLEDLLRQGSAAFARGDYAEAAEVFQKTEDLTDDPGLAAFNKAAALYRMALEPNFAKKRTVTLKEAEQCYRRSLEDATGARRRLALFGLGNSLLQQHPASGVKVLFDAIDSYEQVLADAEADQALKDDARHNLELAKLLWAQERGPNDNKDKPPENDDGNNDPNKDPMRNRPENGGNPTMGAPDPNGQRVPVGVEPGSQPMKVDASPSPGAGNTPPPPDSAEQPLPIEEAKIHLERAVAEIIKEKRQYQMKAVKPPARGVKDW